MPYASWPYDTTARSETNTLRGRFGLSHGDEYASDPHRSAPYASPRRDAATPERYQFTLSSLVRGARERDRY